MNPVDMYDCTYEAMCKAQRLWHLYKRSPVSGHINAIRVLSLELRMLAQIIRERGLHHPHVI